MRALVHIGLALMVAVAPALCCCQARLLAVAHAAPPASAPAAPAPLPAHACCAQSLTATHSCCHEDTEPVPAAATSPEEPPPAPKSPAPCVCCEERPVAAQTESKPQVAAAEPTGKLLPAAHVALAAGSLEHSGLARGLHPPDPGADARFDALFLRHTLRC